MLIHSKEYYDELTRRECVGSILFSVNKDGVLKDAVINARALRNLGLKAGDSFSIFYFKPRIVDGREVPHSCLSKFVTGDNGFVTTIRKGGRRLSSRHKVFAHVNGKVFEECESVYKKWDLVYMPNMVFRDRPVYNLVPDPSSIVTIRRS